MESNTVSSMCQLSVGKINEQFAFIVLVHSSLYIIGPFHNNATSQPSYGLLFLMILLAYLYGWSIHACLPVSAEWGSCPMSQTRMVH